MDVTNPTQFLVGMRELAEKIVAAADANKPIDGNACIQLARMFQDLDQTLCAGGDAPGQWTD
jgi:hypothetical protein